MELENKSYHKINNKIKRIAFIFFNLKIGTQIEQYSPIPILTTRPVRCWPSNKSASPTCFVTPIQFFKKKKNKYKINRTLVPKSVPLFLLATSLNVIYDENNRIWIIFFKKTFC